jgi:hypothetical protein
LSRYYLSAYLEFREDNGGLYVIIQILPYELLAELLTVQEFDANVRTLRAREFTGLNWTNAALKYLHPDLGGVAHLCQYLHISNQRIAWIAREVVDYARYVGPANECIEYFVRVARECLRRSNFNAFFQIVAALGIGKLSAAVTNSYKSD